MKETRQGSKKSWYYYESFINDIKARDSKRHILKSRGYKDIQTWQYTAANGDTIYFLRRK